MKSGERGRQTRRAVEKAGRGKIHGSLRIVQGFGERGPQRKIHPSFLGAERVKWKKKRRNGGISHEGTVGPEKRGRGQDAPGSVDRKLREGEGEKETRIIYATLLVAEPDAREKLKNSEGKR